MNFIDAAMGGDWGTGIMNGFRMGQMMQQQALDEKKTQEDYELNKMLKEEQALKLKAQRTQMENATKLTEQFQPKTTTQTFEHTPTDYETGVQQQQMEPTTTTTTEESPLLQTVRRMHGDDFAETIKLLAASSPSEALKAIVSQPKYTAIPEGGLLNNRTQEVIQGTPKSPKNAYADFAIGYKAKLRAEHPEWDESQLSLETANEAEKRGLNKIIVGANIRGEAFGNIREYPVIDTHNNNSLAYISANDLNAANKATPGRFLPAGEGRQALNKTALLEDIRGNITNTRTSLNNLKTDFNATQRAQIAMVLKSADPKSATQAFMQGAAATTLTPDQMEYVTDLFQLHENAMAMRSVLGAGQGSDELRAAIRATIPGANTPTRDYAKMQLDKFEGVLNRLGKGIPSVPLRNSKDYQTPAQPYATGTDKAGKPVVIDNKQTYDDLESKDMLPSNVKINNSTSQPSQQAQPTSNVRRGAEFNKNVIYLKMAKNRDDAKVRIQALAQQGWKPDELKAIAQEAKWE